MNKFKDKFKSMVSNVSVEVSTQKNIMDKKNSMKKYQKEIVEHYQILGEKVFSKFKSEEGAVIGEFDVECTKIQEIIYQMENTQKDIDDLLKEKEEAKKSEKSNVVIPKSNEIYMDKEQAKKKDMGNIFCKNCGNEIEGVAKFCSKCGTKI